MGVSCIVDCIAGKMSLVGEQNVTNHMGVRINPLKSKLNPNCHLLALLGAHHILHVSRIRVNPPAPFQPATHVRGFKMLNVLDASLWIP
jgi:hypothetical protein